MIIDELFETPQQCPECGGISFSDLILAEKKDACYHKVKASAKVWPSAYASGRLVQCRKKGAANYGNKSESVSEEWSKKYKSSINCSHPKGFSQKAHCAGKKKHNESVETEMVCEDCGMCKTHQGHENLDEACWKGYHKEGNKKMFGKTYPNCVKNESMAENAGQPLSVQQLATISDTALDQAYGYGRSTPGQQSFHSSDVTYNDYAGSDDMDADDHDDDIVETRRGQVPMTLKPGETDNLEPEDSEGFKKLPAYKQGQQAQQSRGKDLIQQSPYTYQSDQDFAYRNGAFDARQAASSADFAKRGPLTTAEGEQKKPKEEKYGLEYDDMVARVKQLAGLGPLKTVYDPVKRVYRNMPTAVQPKK